jgi:uncharacterized protein YjdB
MGGGKSHPNRIASITLSPATATIIAGATQQFNGKATTNSGQTITGNNGATWASSNAAIATVDANGLATGVAPGTVTITATVQTGAGPVSGNATLTVTAPPKTLTSVQVAPASASILTNATQQFTAKAVYSDSSTADVTQTATWASTNTAVAIVSSSGVATGVSGGSASITAGVSSGNGTVIGSSSLTVTVPGPAVSISVNPSWGVPGTTSTLTWSSTGATTCTASGAWSGGVPTSGSQQVTEAAIGNYNYSLSCIGNGSSTSRSASLLVTNVKPSSYENKNDLGIAGISLSAFKWYYNAIAIADFLNDGGQTVVFHTVEYDPNNSNTYNNYGHIHFYEKDQTGTWIEKTAQLLANNTGCIHPRKAVVTDLNRDGKPDVYFGCTGVDAPPFPGEEPHALLSQPDGTYKNVTIPVTCYCHGASAADINGDGYPDVLVTDNMVAQTPYFLMNNGDGTFTPDYTRLPSSLKNKGIFSAELIDFSGSGKYDVFLAGNEPGTTNYPATEFGEMIFPNDGNGVFTSTTPVNLFDGTAYGLALDIVVQNGSVYLLKVNSGYTANEIQKISYPGLQKSTIFSNSGTYSNGATWLNWIIPYNSQLVSEDASYGVSVPQ